ncbi:MAG TPA: HAMP domain-containing sensor histidine kinase [Candidatus Eremiobacteraceae bacterium]
MSEPADFHDLVHDIRNRLSIARANIEAFIDGKLTPSAARLTSVLQTLDQLNELLERLKSGQATVDTLVRPTEVDVCELLDKEYIAAEAAAAKKGVSFAVARCAVKAEECGRFFGDPVRIGQIVSNVLSNAIKFTPSGGTVLIGCSRRADQLEISVTDSGPGVAAADKDRIFKRGVRGSAAKDSEGSGFGLAIAKKFVEAHGGAISSSPAGAGGSRFVVSLPGTVFPTDDAAANRCARCAAGRHH